jgi:CBS domain containing-hemolysin-like protein
MTEILLVAGLTLFASFLCSLFEAALYALTPAQIEVLRTRGDPNANRLGRLRSQIEEPIAAILTINTIAHTIGASVCGALVGARYGSAAVGVFAAVFTVLVLALTEIVPKSLGVRYAEAVGPRMVLPLRVMIAVAWPLVWIVKRAARRLAEPNAVAGPSEEEVLAVSRLAARSGRVRDEEHRWIRNALRLDAVTAGELRTPRPVVETIAADTPLVEIRDRPDRWTFSRIPVTEEPGSKDHVIGCLHRRDALDKALRDPEGTSTARDIMRPLRFIPASMPAHRLLSQFLVNREHIAGVLDQYGIFQGVVTLEDVIECLLGEEIVDEYDQDADLREVARRRRRDTELPKPSDAP